MKHRKGFCIATILLLLLVMEACQKNTIHRFRAVDSSSWSRKDTVTLQICNVKQEGKYDLSVEVRIGRQFPYQNLPLVVDVRTQKDLISHDTLCLYLLDSLQQMAGQGRTIREFTLPLCPLSIQPYDTLDVSIRHILPQETVEGVHDVGIGLSPN